VTFSEYRIDTGYGRSTGFSAMNNQHLTPPLPESKAGSTDVLILPAGRRENMGAKASSERTVQFKVSPDLKKEICRSALERDETVRAFILKALKDRGIAVSDNDLVDRRKAGAR
jgi:hypothetical protein